MESRGNWRISESKRDGDRNDDERASEKEKERIERIEKKRNEM